MKIPQCNFALDQGHSKACSAFAVTMARMLNIYQLTNKWIPLDPYSIYNNVSNGSDGIGIRYAIKYACDYGIAPLNSFTTDSAHYRITNAICINSIEEIEDHLLLNHPVVTGIIIDRLFGRRENGIEPNYPNKKHADHAICIIDVTVINDKKYFVCVNSYGSKVNGGIIYLPYTRILRIGGETFAICDEFTEILPAYNSIKFKIKDRFAECDGELLKLEHAPYIKNDRTFFPVRKCAEMFGMRVYWDGKNDLATLIDEMRTISISPHNCVLGVNDYCIEIDTPPEIKGGRMMAPIRPIAELVGYNVDFIDDTIIMERII